MPGGGYGPSGTVQAGLGPGSAGTGLGGVGTRPGTFGGVGTGGVGPIPGVYTGGQGLGARKPSKTGRIINTFNN